MSTAVKPKSKKKKKILIAAIAVLALALLVSGTLAAVGLSVSAGDTILPNVTVNGTPVGGMTIAQAADRLAVPMETAAVERAVTVYFPGDTIITVTSEEAGLALSGEQAAQIAFEYGRTDNFFTNGWSFFRCQFVAVDVDPLLSFNANRAMIRDAVQAAAEEIDLLSQGAYEVVDDHLVVVKGQLVVVFDEDRLITLIAEAFSEGAHEPLYYDAETMEPEPINLTELYESLSSEPENAVYDHELEQPTEHVVGLSFDLPLAQTLYDVAAPGEEVLIPLILIDPEITTEYLRAVLFRDTLASSTTQLTSDENRNTNITLAAQEIDGMVLNPGERFDFNTVVGQRTAERGFRPAGAFRGTEVVQATGGGICQVSSTIYHALLHTDLQVDVRRNHTLVVTYLPLGMDAAVSWNGPHFSFTNSSPFPLRIVTYRDGQNFHVRLEGTRTHDYRIVPEDVYINTVAFRTTYQDDPSLPTGTTSVITAGRVGHVVDVFQRFYDADGNLVRRELVDRSSYHPIDQVVARGTGTAAAPTTPAQPTPTPSDTSDPPDDTPPDEDEM